MSFKKRKKKQAPTTPRYDLLKVFRIQLDVSVQIYERRELFLSEADLWKAIICDSRARLVVDVLL